MEKGAREVAAVAERELTEYQVPSWLRTIGLSSWMVVGIVAVAAVALFLLGLVADVAIPVAIAAVLAAILVPLTDRLERWRIPRWLGATLVLVLALSVVIATVALVVNGITGQADAIWSRLTAGIGDVSADAGATAETAAAATGDARKVVHLLVYGALPSIVSTASGVIVGCVLALFVLLFLLKDWHPITAWTAGHIGMPAPIGRRVLDGTVNAFRGYAAGLTLIGVANAAVVGAGALILGVPLVGTIALVTFVSSYIPYIGAVVAGAFAVLIAYGAEGVGVAVAMLAVTLIANNSMQNLLEPFAFGSRLHLHPLAVLIIVTTATMLFGILGAILAAPLASATVNAIQQIRDIRPATTVRLPD